MRVMSDTPRQVTSITVTVACDDGSRTTWSAEDPVLPQVQVSVPGPGGKLGPVDLTLPGLQGLAGLGPHHVRIELSAGPNRPVRIEHDDHVPASVTVALADLRVALGYAVQHSSADSDPAIARLGAAAGPVTGWMPPATL